MKRLGVTSLKTLHMSEPLGIDVKPYFSWVVKSEERNTVQEAYQIVVVDEEKSKFGTVGKLSQIRNHSLHIVENLLKAA